MHKPLVSIIIPTYNRAHLIGETLDSVLAQTYENWECIIVDDGSTDNSAEVIGEYVWKDSRFQYHVRPETHSPGGCGARNYGAEVAESKFISFLDSDDLYIPTTLKNRMKYLSEQNCSTDMLINNTATFKTKIGDNDKLWNVMNKYDSNEELVKKFLNNDMPWHTNGVTWSKDFYEKLGGWNNQLRAWQDWEIHIKALMLNPQVVHFDSNPDNYYKIEGSNSIKDGFNTINYYRSVRVAFYSISNALKSNNSISENVKDEFNKLAIRILIKTPIVNNFIIEFFENLYKVNFNYGINKLQFFKVSCIEIIGKSYKLRKFVINKTYLKQQEYMKPSSLFMQLTHFDIK